MKRKMIAIIWATAVVTACTACGNVMSTGSETTTTVTTDSTETSIDVDISDNYSEAPEGNTDDNSASKAPDDSQISKYGLVMSLKNITSTSATIVFKQDSDDISGGTGADYVIEQKDNGTWKELEAKDLMAFIDILYMIDSSEEMTLDIDWTNMYGELKPGSYRLKKNVFYDEQYTLYSEFEIK